MAISDKTRKVLWGRSGNRCALCRRELVNPGTQTDDSSVVGDECHIVSERDHGPRSSAQLHPEDYDKCKNLILLCKVHHKLVDDQPNTYTAERLRNLKSRHEAWVRDSLGQGPQGRGAREEPVHLLPRIRTGKELMDLCAGAFGLILDHDEPESDEEVVLLGDFLQNVQDWGDIWDGVDSGEHVRVRFSMTQKIKQLEEMGFLVFAIRQDRRLEVAATSSICPMLVMTVVRQTNPGITALGTLAAKIRS